MPGKNKYNARKNLKIISKNYKVLRTSWHVQTRLFFEHSTLHGVRYIAENARPFTEKFMWFSCVGIGAVTTIVIIVSLWEKFQTNPTITGLDTDFHNWDVPFPAITVCQEFPSNLSRIQDYIDEHAHNIPFSISSEEYIQFFTTLSKLSFNTIKEFTSSSAYSVNSDMVPPEASLRDLTFEFMNRCEEIFDTCEWLSAPYNCCDGFFPVFTESGFCYTFNSRHYEKTVPWLNYTLPDFQMRYISETDLKWALSFTIKNNDVKMPIYILNSDEEAGIDLQPQHIWEYKVNAIEFSVKQTYTTEDTNQLSIKQRHCIFADEIKLKIDHIYTFTACTRQCRMDNAMKYCQCVPHFYPERGHYKHCKMAQLKCIGENLAEIKAVDQCNCQLGCSNTVYEVEKLTESSEDTKELETRFVSWPMVRYKREVLFGWVDLLVSFGGIAGLFLGFSLLSGVEILYYFTIRACCMAVREREDLERIRYEEDSKPPKDYDLSLIPYFIAEPFPGNGMNTVANSYFQLNLRKRNNVVPFKKNPKWKGADTLLPPFGIEFIN